jgi:hypothetical protein
MKILNDLQKLITEQEAKYHQLDQLMFKHRENKDIYNQALQAKQKQAIVLTYLHFALKDIKAELSAK